MNLIGLTNEDRYMLTHELYMLSHMRFKLLLMPDRYDLEKWIKRENDVIARLGYSISEKVA